MTPVQIGRERFSKIFWDIVDERVGDYPYEVIEKIVEDQQKLRDEAEYNTGSLPYDDAVELYKLVKFFQPDVIAEVGTFIGISTRSMLEAAPWVEIYTCDMSNNIDLMLDNDVPIVQYPKRSSTYMFKDLADKKIGVDFMYIDGRLQQEDFEHFPKIIHDQTVFVFDDFVGVEKGVVNAMMLNGANRHLVYPRESRKTAVSIPFALLQFVPQEMT